MNQKPSPHLGKYMEEPIPTSTETGVRLPGLGQEGGLSSPGPSIPKDENVYDSQHPAAGDGEYEEFELRPPLPVSPPPRKPKPKHMRSLETT